MNFKIELPESDIKCWKDHLNMLGSKLPTFKDLAIKQKWDSIYYKV